MTKPRLVLRTKGFAYVPMAVLLLPFALWATAEAFAGGGLDALKFAGFLYGVLLIFDLYLLSFKVIVADGELRVRNLYIWHHIPLTEIGRAYIQTSIKTAIRDWPTFRIWVEPRKGSGYRGFFIPIVTYKPEDLHQLYEVLGIKSKRTRLFSREKGG